MKTILTGVCVMALSLGGAFAQEKSTAAKSSKETQQSTKTMTSDKTMKTETEVVSGKVDSYEPGKSDRVVLIMNVIPGEEPSSGPNYYAFDPSVTYSIGIDNDRDGTADDVRFDVRFANEIRGFTKDLGLPLRYIGGGPLPVVDDVDDPGNGLRQTYQVTMNGKKLHPGALPVLPDNVGPHGARFVLD